MAGDKVKPRIGKHDAGQLDRWHRNATSQPEILATAEVQTRRNPYEGNQNSLVHGIYADRFLSPEERPLFEAIIGQLYQDFVFNKSSDFMQVKQVAVYFLKLGRAQEAGDWDAAERLDRMIRCHLKDLKATKIAREGEVPRGPGTTPAEWATALLEKVAESQKKPPEAGQETENAKMMADNTIAAFGDVPERCGFPALQRAERSDKRCSLTFRNQREAEGFVNQSFRSAWKGSHSLQLTSGHCVQGGTVRGLSLSSVSARPGAGTRKRSQS